MTKDTVKKGFELAEKELEEQAVEKVKDIVKGTLRKIKDIDKDVDDLKEKLKDLEDKKRLLKLDIDDLKEGRLDRIEERQKADEKAKKVSVVIVEKEIHHHHYDFWHTPYKITYVPYYPPAPSNPMCFGNSLKLLGSPTVYTTSTTSNNSDYTSFSLNASVAKHNVKGSYAIGDGSTVHLR